MIEEIHIENVGVISEARLELAPSLTAVTGETGAGKTMVLTSLALLLGGRADPAVVRSGAERAVVEGVVVAVGDEVVERALDAGASLDEDALLLVRAVPALGRSRAWLGGRAVPQAVLAEVTADLVTVHGQSDQLRLRAPARQRAALDGFAGSAHQDVLRRYRDAFAEWSAARAQLEAWDRDAVARDEELSRLRAGLTEVDGLAPVPGEDAALREEADRLGHVEELRAAASSAYTALNGDDGAGYAAAPGSDVVGAVEAARRGLEQASALDPRLGEWAQRLAETVYLLNDVGVELSSYLADLQADPVRLAAVHERRAALADAVRRLVPAPPGEAARGLGDLLAWAERARHRVADLADPAVTRDALACRVLEAQDAVGTLAAELRAGRQSAALALASAVEVELAGLAMPGARLEARFSSRPEPGPWGTEDVELALSAHPGAPALPLGRGASGGELSRVMLALELVLASAPGAGPPPTFVFDEVDAGVGGKAAREVGRRLAELGRQAQVIVVTHLAQVAAFADRHLVVTKTTLAGEDVVTESDVRPVEGAERVRELARMLSGQEDSQTARRHAEELLDLAGVGRLAPR